MNKNKKLLIKVPQYRILYIPKSTPHETRLGQTFITKAQAEKRLRQIRKNGNVFKATIKYLGRK